jgi:hypothetical protein
MTPGLCILVLQAGASGDGNERLVAWRLAKPRLQYNLGAR